jgi:hypothetical protein
MNSSVKSLAFAGILVLTGLGTAQAAGVCNCCSGQVEELCKSACTETNQGNAVCRPAAWYGDADAVGGDRPLNGFSFKGLDLSGASRQELEAIRVWLEKQRRATEVRANRTLRNMKRGSAYNGRVQGQPERTRRSDHQLPARHSGLYRCGPGPVIQLQYETAGQLKPSGGA